MLGDTLALTGNGLGFKLLVKGRVVFTHSTHDGAGDVPRLQGGARHGRNGVVGFKKAVPEVADLGLQTLDIIRLHGSSIARRGGGSTK